MRGTLPQVTPLLARIGMDIGSLERAIGEHFAWDIIMSYQTTRFAFRFSWDAWKAIQTLFTRARSLIIALHNRMDDAVALGINEQLDIIVCNDAMTNYTSGYSTAHKDRSDEDPCHLEKRATEYFFGTVLLTPIYSTCGHGYILQKGTSLVIIQAQQFAVLVEVLARWTKGGDAYRNGIFQWIALRNSALNAEST